MVPLRPTIQQILADGAEPASKSVMMPLGCTSQVFPASEENKMTPAGPIRQDARPSGAETVTAALPLARSNRAFWLRLFKSATCRPCIGRVVIADDSALTSTFCEACWGADGGADAGGGRARSCAGLDRAHRQQAASRLSYAAPRSLSV